MHLCSVVFFLFWPLTVFICEIEFSFLPFKLNYAQLKWARNADGWWNVLFKLRFLVSTAGQEYWTILHIAQWETSIMKKNVKNKRVQLSAMYLDNNRTIVLLSTVHRWNICWWLWRIVYYCSILLQHVLTLIYIHPWHHICLLRITYPDLSFFYFPVTWFFKWFCSLSGVSSLFVLISIL